MNRNIKDLYDAKTSVTNEIELRPSMASDFVEEALNIILPGTVRFQFEGIEEFEQYIELHLVSLDSILKTLKIDCNKRIEIKNNYKENLITLSRKIDIDAKALLAGDPAAKNLCEVILSYPGLLAIAIYRLAHFFYEEKIDIFPRMISEYAHAKTGIDIHPGAKIGESFFIDHGTGVVIGETAIIGDRVKIYQGVTLGALSVSKDLQNIKRHPTIENDCVIYAHATILGGDTIVGEGSVIGGNVWLTKSIPKHSVVYHKSEIRLDSKNKNFNMEELTYEI